MRTNWQFWEAAIDRETCNHLTEKFYEQANFVDATIFGDGQYSPNNSVRSTQVSFIKDEGAIELVRHYLIEANRNAFGFDVNYIPALQFGEYSEGSFYNWHHDINWDGDAAFDRKLSIIIQLTDENEYEGGNFEFKYIQTPESCRKQGSVLVFPSYNEHRVTEVTKGVRNSLVCWMEGPRWR